MKDELKAERPSGSLEGGLERALEELLAGHRAQRAGTTAGHENPTVESNATACPHADAWLRLLHAGGASADVDAALAHVAGCAFCSERARMLFREASAEESESLKEMASGTAAWQKEVAGELARTPIETTGKRGQRWYVWAGSGLAAMLLIGAVLTFWWRFANAPERLLAEAYTHARIFDLRMPGAGFAEVMPPVHLRGGGSTHEPAKLLAARAQIESQLKRKPGDERWLQLEARADIMQENFDPAIEILNRLLANGPPTSSLLTDDAAAYFERGMATGSEEDRGTALGYLRQADALAPGDGMILFNEAVVMEDQGQAMSAVETWNRYISFERDPRWLAEGRRRLAGLEEKLKEMKTLGDRAK